MKGSPRYVKHILKFQTYTFLFCSTILTGLFKMSGGLGSTVEDTIVVSGGKA